MTVFGVLTYLGCYFFQEKGKHHKAAIIKSLSPAILYGLLIELLQTFIPQRGFDYADVTADIIGAFVGVILFRYHVDNKFEES